jgi:predicted anti-sigma-YlaC factor YlaD
VRSPRPVAVALWVTLLPLAGCKSAALSFASDAVAQSGTGYGSDDDPELVRDAVPFGLKTMEGLLQEKPKHLGLLTALTSSFTQYAYAFVQADAEKADLEGHLDAARAGRERARKLFLRARDYGLRGLSVSHDHLGDRLRTGGPDATAALGDARKKDVPLLYWTASAWTLAVVNGKGDMALVAQLPTAVAMMDRALALDEAWDEGAIHEFFVSYDATRSAAEGGGPERVRQHLDRALALSHGHKLGVKVAYAEGLLVQQQDRAGFTQALQEVLAADPGAEPKYRLANTIAQRRARLLLDHSEDLFL